MSQCRLTWDSFHKNICNGFTRLQQSEEFVDMTLAADGHLVKVHKNLLALASPYIKQMLQTAPCQHPVLFLNNVSHEILTYILQYIYTGEVNVQTEHLGFFIEAAKALHIEGIKDLINPVHNSLLQKKPRAMKYRTQKISLTDLVNIRKTKDINKNGSYVQNVRNSPLEQAEEQNSESEPDDVIKNESPENFLQCNRNQLFRLATPAADQHVGENSDRDFVQSTSFARGPLNLEQQNIPNAIQNTNNLNSDQILETCQSNQGVQHTYDTVRNSEVGYDYDMASQAVCDESNISEVTNSFQNNINYPIRIQTIGHNLNESYIPVNKEDTSTHNYDSNLQLTDTATDFSLASNNVDIKHVPRISIAVEIPDGNGENTCPQISIQPYVPGKMEEPSNNLPAQPVSGATPLYVTSNRGSIQMILNRFVYNLHHTSHSDRKRRWRCVNYRNLRCKAYVDTDNELIVNRKFEHRHPHHDNKIAKKARTNVLFNSMLALSNQTKRRDVKMNEERRGKCTQ